MSNYKKYLISISVLISFLFYSNQAFSQASEIAAETAVSKVVADLTDSIKGIINNLEASATTVSFDIRSDLLVVMDNLNILGNELVGKTFGELSQAQKQFFENSNALVQDSLSGAELTVDKVDGVVASMGEALSRVIGVDNRPFVTKYSPSYVVTGKESYALSVNGSLVGNGKPSLTFGDKKCEIKTKTERKLEFKCPKTIFRTNDRWVSGDLVVSKKKPWWAIFSSADSYKYNLSVRSIDENLGTYTLDIYVTETTEERKNRSQSNGHRNEHCQGGRNKAWTYSPSANCKIDVSTAKIASKSVSSQSTLQGISSLTPNGFRITGRVSNNGDCAPRILGQRAFRDGRGSINVTATWVDVCTVEAEVKKETITGSLSWKKEESFQLPENASRFVLNIQQNDGKVVVANGTGSHKWFNVNYDPAGKIAIFRPKPLEVAFK